MLATLILTLAGGHATVALPAAQEVRGVEVTLGEIADVSGLEGEALAQLESFSIGYAPAPGYSRLFRAPELQRRLATAFPGVRWTFAGAPACRVTPVVETVGSERLRAAAEAELRKHLGEADSQVALVGSLTELIVPRGEGPCRLRPAFRYEGLKAGRWNVPVEVLVDDDVYRTVWTTWQVDLFAVQPVVTRDLSPGDILGPESIERRRTLVPHGFPARGLSEAALDGAVVTRRLVRGHVLRESDVRRPLAILKGDTLHLEVKKGAISARVTARALEGGAVGERIRVANLQSGQELTAVIVSRELAQIDLGQPGR